MLPQSSLGSLEFVTIFSPTTFGTESASRPNFAARMASRLWLELDSLASRAEECACPGHRRPTVQIRAPRPLTYGYLCLRPLILNYLRPFLRRVSSAIQLGNIWEQLVCEHVHAEGLSFEYRGTNANNATFEFAPSDIK